MSRTIANPDIEATRVNKDATAKTSSVEHIYRHEASSSRKLRDSGDRHRCSVRHRQH